MKLSASQAAKEVGKSVMTITRACKSGRLSYEGEKGGPYLIDPAELFRVFPPVANESGATPQMLNGASPNVTSVLEGEVKMLREILERTDRELADVRTDRDHWRQQATSLLTDQSPKGRAVARSWWPWRARNGSQGS